MWQAVALPQGFGRSFTVFLLKYEALLSVEVVAVTKNSDWSRQAPHSLYLPLSSSFYTHASLSLSLSVFLSIRPLFFPSLSLSVRPLSICLSLSLSLCLSLSMSRSVSVSSLSLYLSLSLSLSICRCLSLSLSPSPSPSLSLSLSLHMYLYMYSGLCPSHISFFCLFSLSLSISLCRSLPFPPSLSPCPTLSLLKSKTESAFIPLLLRPRSTDHRSVINESSPGFQGRNGQSLALHGVLAPVLRLSLRSWRPSQEVLKPRPGKVPKNSFGSACPRRGAEERKKVLRASVKTAQETEPVALSSAPRFELALPEALFSALFQAVLTFVPFTRSP